MEFQVVGDLHFSNGTYAKYDFSTLLIATKPFLITTGDIISPTSISAYNFYMYCAKNWEKTYIIMGNQEYETRTVYFHMTMKKHFTLMKSLLDCINTEIGTEKLIFIQNNFVDIPDHSLRIAALTLWADGTVKRLLKTDEVLTMGFSDKNTRIDGAKIRTETEATPERAGSTNTMSLPVISWNPVQYAGEEDCLIRASITDDDLKILQEEDTTFLTKMVSECSEKMYKLLVCSHYIPTTLIKKESPIIEQENEFPINFFCRDMSSFFQEPIVAWVCGHVHLEQTVIINNIPIYINNKTITI